MNYKELVAGNYNVIDIIDVSNTQQRMVERLNLVCDSSGGNINIQLPSMSSMPSATNFCITVDDKSGTGASTGKIITIYAGSGDTINFNATTYVFSTAYQKVSIQVTLNNQSSSAYGNWLILSPLAATASGTVTSVALSMPNIFSTAGSPITTSGTLAVSLATQPRNYVFAGPSSGADDFPTFRALVANDLSVISIALAMPNIFSVSGSPVSANGTFTVALATQAANIVFAGPSSGLSAIPTFRSLVLADLPAGIATVTSVGLALPVSVFSISGSPVTSSGTLTGTFINQEINLAFLSPVTGSPGVPTFRSIDWRDMPRGTTRTVTVDGTSALTLNSSDSTTYVYTGAGAASWTLPVIAANTGQLFFVKNRGAGTVTVSVSGGGALIYSTVAASTFDILPGLSYILQNDGTYWIVM